MSRPRPPLRRKQPLANTGGPVTPWGDKALAAQLARCLDVDPGTRPPLTHGFHAYPARMHPVIAERAIAIFGKPGMRVLDPFVGSGTVALEAARAGLRFTGTDISVVALEVAWARTRLLSAHEARLIEREGEALAARAAESPGSALRPPGWGPDVESWFSPHTLREIALLADLIDGVKDEVRRRIFRVILSSNLIRLSKQASDSITVVDRDWHPWRPRAAYRMFAERCHEVALSFAQLGTDVRSRKVEWFEPELILADARDPGHPKGIFGMGLASPPYPGTYDYAFHHFLRYPLFGETPAFVRRCEIGARRDFKAGGDAVERYVDDMTQCVKCALDALQPGAPLLMLIGDGRTRIQAVRSDLVLKEVAGRLAAVVEAGATQERTEWSQGGGEQKKGEHFILIRRPR